MPISTNTARVRRIQRLMTAYRRYSGDVPEDILTDLLADMRHACRAKGLNFARLNERATQHFLAEGPTSPSDWPGYVKGDYLTCFGYALFDSEAAADAFAQHVEERGEIYWGGWHHGMPCGRESTRDQVDPQTGRHLFAVTYSCRCAR